MPTPYKSVDVVLVAGNNTLYTTASGTTIIRSILVFNPTASPIELNLSKNGLQFKKVTIASYATATIPEFVNSQIDVTKTLMATGTGLNVSVSVQEVV